MSNSTGIEKTQAKSSCARFHFVKALEVFLLSGSHNTPIRTFSLELSHLAHYIFSI